MSGIVPTFKSVGDDYMVLIHLQDIHFEVKDRTLFEINNISIHKGDRIGLVGRNGSGKTSLLELIAGEKAPASGTVTKHSTVALLPQLKPKTGQKSGGETSQLVIDEILTQEPEVLLADEPTTHLDIEHLEKLEQQLKRPREALVVVSHDRAFLDALCNQIWEIEDGQIHEYTGNYSDYEQQKIEAHKHHEKEYKKIYSKEKAIRRSDGTKRTEGATGC